MTVQTTLADLESTSAAIFWAKKRCQQSTMTQKRLEALGIHFEVRDLAEHLADAERLRRAGHLAVPVVEPTNPTIPAWAGFRPDRIQALAATTARTRD